MNTLTNVKTFLSPDVNKKTFTATNSNSYNVFSAFFAALGLLLMLALPMWFVFNKITFSTHFEESVGFRYVHSLRILYGYEHPWLPPGQLQGILHIAVQKLLTLFGHPIDEFFPRI